ncbi:MAG: 2-isopropylmalate synthase [Deltaproteobacteria bacterium]|nr:2-isopropylmalate synthase [Deltaproteobacteria bacterium]
MAEQEPWDDTLVYDWNAAGGDLARPLTHRVMVLDETLRDGLQSPSIIDPPLKAKRELLRRMDAIGVDVADLGLPGAGARVARHVAELCATIRDEGLSVRAACAGRTLASDIEPIIQISRETGVIVEILTFLGASPIRAYAEGWTLTQMRKLAADAVRMGTDAGLPVAFVTEDTLRAHPDVLSELYRAALGEGATRIIICDTVGHATPDGVRANVTWHKELLDKLGRSDVGLDYHGHDDRWLGTINTLTAARAGCDRLHATALGIGERVGNTGLDVLLVNMNLLGWRDTDLPALPAYCEQASIATGRPIPANYPAIGRDAFRTTSGIHAAAILKARRRHGEWLADRIYSGVPANLLGRHQEIDVGYMSGASNVQAWLEEHGQEARDEVVAAIVRAAKRSHRTFRDEEVTALVAAALEELAATAAGSGDAPAEP